jgi:outer membrane protein
VSQALAQNPGLLSLRAQQESANWAVKSAKSEFLPSINFNAGYGRYNQQQDTIRSSGTNPWNFTVGVSIPLFEGLSRNVQVQQARGQSDDLHQAIRSRELTVRSEVVAALNGVQAAYRTIDLQRANKAAALEALDLGTQRYRVGSGTYLELLDARVTADKADADYVTAVYDYHKAIATLENAVGRPLR